MEVIPYEIPLGTAKIGPRFEFKCAKKIKTENTVLPSNRPPYSFFF